LIRFILDLNAGAHVGHQKFQSLNLLPVKNGVLCHVFKIKHKLAPAYMAYHLVPQDTVHSYRTRLSQRGGFSLPNVNGSGSKSFSFVNAKLLNTLPANISDIAKLQSFKVAIKSFFIKGLKF